MLTVPPNEPNFTGMTIHLKPELEALIQQDVQRGPYQTADEFVERAVQMLHDQEQWLADDREDIAAKVEAGYASAERGDLIDAEQVRTGMNQRKQIWREQNKQ
jgi:antitoxin ParD1/3/4